MVGNGRLDLCDLSTIPPLCGWRWRPLCWLAGRRVNRVRQEGDIDEVDIMYENVWVL